MTFLEAAIEVLRHETEALHFSEIAKRAVERDLLSHVGRDPETAMKSCLTSAVRGNPEGAVLMRAKPGHYQVKPGAELPDPPEGLEKPAKATKKKATKKKATKKKATKKTAAKKKSTKKKASKKAASEGEPLPEKANDDEPLAADSSSEEGEPEAERSGASLSFEAPSGSGLEGPTDIALVMANAMSRLVDERPELKSEFEAMQQNRAAAEEEEDSSGPTIERRGERGRTREDRGESEERGGRRRRRRRKRGRRVDWGAASTQNTSSPQALLLDELAKILSGAGAKSFHVRQLAEQLANVEGLGGDISELERASTAAMLVDIGRFGSASRFVARGDARFQLRGSRVPKEAAEAEQALYAAVRKQDETTRAQLTAWLRSLGPRALEAVIRIYLEHERFALRASTSPGRGVARLWVDDPELEGDAKTMALIVPAATSVERRLWEGEDAGGNEPILLFAVGEVPDNLPSRIRVVGCDELVRWMIERRVGVRTVKVEVSALDPSLIESIRGLDA